MFTFDVETLHNGPRAVILSMGCIHFNGNEKSIDELQQNIFFSKLDASKQSMRIISESTITWWKNQSKEAKEYSFNRDKRHDEDPVEAINRFHSWIKQVEPKFKHGVFWSRGSFDSILYEDLCVDFKIEPIIPWNRWRDIRTAVDILVGGKNGMNGYAGIDINVVKNFDESQLIAHQPVDDCLRDTLMLLHPIVN